MANITDKWVDYLRNRNHQHRETTQDSEGVSNTSGEKTTTDTIAPSRRRQPRQVYKGPSDYVVEGLVGEHQVNRLVDTGAERNFVSAQFVQKAGLTPYETDTKTVQLAGGRKTESTGSVKLARSLFGSHLRMSLLGDERQRLWGSMDSIYTHALLDTGCDLDLVGAAWARANNFKIDQGPEHRLPLELGDGTRISTTGIVRDVTWTFGDSREKVCSDFYVLDALSADVVFGGDFIMERDVFSEFSHFMIHLDYEARAPERQSLG
ncbi:uncharacterized protein NECHADRAFT_80820 [Fusarium vanettenii 77-13-4]|uniref:Peptidase A2 domain-containing protein n=1 Tax=Fusarium vanettenii (strain ATCC MYA-4622 / CBS 123669 / FGSC 9596 / NRRL 45880 / 77-13-4) TaxID=660122 RepID=C7YSR0_FUSV7|nr:uncharacterized protein NECHADRAFT_80820 [Fusarium vanettenii 77-13-4]EEU45686.1 hypothetical protein NECHADRAFT_80820 [Fusarium vanettenii 77-13-4]